MSPVFFLIYCLNGAPSLKSGVSNSPTITMGSVYFPWVCLIFTFIFRWFNALSINICNFYMVLMNWSLYHYVVTYLVSHDMSRFYFVYCKYVPLNFLCLWFSWGIIVSCLGFSSCVTLNLKQAAQNWLGFSSLLILSLMFLIGIFKSYTFLVITGR